MFRTALQLARIATAAVTGTVTGVVSGTVTALTGGTDDRDLLAPDPADVFNADEVPTEEEISASAAAYAKAADQARAAERNKRAAKKLISRLPAGLYGGRWLIERVVSTRQTPDLDAIRATYKRHGLGEVPMKEVAASLRVTDIAPVTVPAPVDLPVAAVTGADVDVAA
ncbi:hypothetical protein OG982_06200 [Streptomyces sp. NBC_01551]|uniref:hypothetical protein n=1 Tax=Streptomyces sp. NBC_01551 TaxID=2975876 RepID=UPI00225477A6|nr:hypothetical protein [Streptomyces sp. NBC_01551]MCX4525285.1 hypothetical protein [Streptomyces sp. NBC_01551]